MRKTYRNIILFFPLLFVFVFAFNFQAKAQQLPIYSQYWMNKFLLNPAIAGHEGYTAVNLTVREQWVGLPDAPETYAITGQTRLLKNSYISRNASIRKRNRAMSRSGRVGYGGYIFSDNNGIFNKTGMQGTYAYHLTLRRSQLSFGLSGILYQYKINKDNIKTFDDYASDLKLINAKDKSIIFDANFGSYYSDRNLYAGFSVLNLFESFINLTPSTPDYKLERNYLFMAGYRYDIIDFLFVEPAALLKASEKAVVQLDLGINTYIKEDYWVGIAYRTGSGNRISHVSLEGRGSSINFFGGARVDKYYFGYCFDYTLSSIGSKTLGSHEITIAAKFGDSARRYRWLNRY